MSLKAIIHISICSNGEPATETLTEADGEINQVPLPDVLSALHEDLYRDMILMEVDGKMDQVHVTAVTQGSLK